jgi:D-lactate dehydrogenase
LEAGTFVNSVFGKNAMIGLTKGFKNLIPEFPLWSNQLITSGAISGKYVKEIDLETKTGPAVVYFPTCISRVMGGAPNKKSIPDSFLSVSEKSGIEVIIPAGIEALCCGQLFSSKGDY